MNNWLILDNGAFACKYAHRSGAAAKEEYDDPHSPRLNMMSSLPVVPRSHHRPRNGLSISWPRPNPRIDDTLVVS